MLCGHWRLSEACCVHLNPVLGPSMCCWGRTEADELLGRPSTSTHPKAEPPPDWLFTMSALLTWLRISNIWAQSSKYFPRDLFGCWSRKWIFYSWLVWSITYKLLLYFVAHGREVLVGEVMDKTKGNLNEDNKKASSRWDNLKRSTLWVFSFFLCLVFKEQRNCCKTN